LFEAPETMSPDKRTLDELRIDRPSAPRRKPPVALIAAVIAAVIVGGALVWAFNRPGAQIVRTAVAQASASGGDKTLLNASGYVTARREATVSSKVTGKVVEILVEEGMKVEAGQVLARLDASNVERSLLLAEAQSESARRAMEEINVDLAHAERELRRVTQLAARRVASQSELDRADSDARSLKARLNRQEADAAVAEREVALWRQQLEDTIIRAPFTAIVTSKNAQPGEMISPMSAGGSFTRTGICTIVDMSSLEIEVDVSESYINRVESGQPAEATLDSYPDWRIPAKVIAVIPTADRQKATVKVRVGFEALDPRILPEMGVKVAFQRAGEAPVAAKREVMIPKAAVQQRDGRDLVWVVRDGRAERRAVTLGDTLGENVAVIAGIDRSDKVVVEGPENLTDGAKVEEEKR
jgi:HlyD family secretion protein